MGLQPSTEAPLAAALNLGFVAERITVDQTEARWHMRIAGFSGAVMGIGEPELFADASDEKQARIRVVGINTAADGSLSALGGLLRPRDTTPTETSSAQHDQELMPNYEWPEIRIAINKAALASRVAARNPRVTRQEAWANQLNRSYRRGLWQQAKPNLLHEYGSYRTYLNYIGNTCWTTLNLMMVANLVNDDYASAVQLGGLAAFIYGGQMAKECAGNLLATGSTHIAERRWSIFPTLGHVDRLALTGLALQLGRPVFAAKQS